MDLSILRGTFFVQPDVKISRFLSLSFDTRRPASSLTDHIFFPSSFFFFSPEYLCLAIDDFFSTGGFKGEFILSRPRRQISGIESLFSIRTPSLRTTFAPSSLVEIDIDDLNLRFSFGHASPPHSFRSLSAKADRGTRADHNGG